MSTAPAGGRAALAEAEALGQPGFDLDFQVVGELTEPRPIGRRRLAERLEKPRHEPALAGEVAVANAAHLRLAPRVREIAIESSPEGVNFEAGIGRHRTQARAAGLAAAAALASTANAVGLVTARSASDLRSIGLPAAFRPAIS